MHGKLTGRVRVKVRIRVRVNVRVRVRVRVRIRVGKLMKVNESTHGCAEYSQNLT